MSFDKESVAMVGFEVVAYSGEARSKLLEALKMAESKNFDKAESLIAEAHNLLMKAHESQTEMLSAEARGEDVELGFIMIHGQDHLMTAMLLEDLMKHFVNLYQQLA